MSHCSLTGLFTNRSASVLRAVGRRGAPPGWRWPRWWTWVGPGAQGGLVAYVNTPRTVRSREFRWCGERYLHAEAELKERAPAQTTSPRERCNHASGLSASLPFAIWGPSRLRWRLGRSARVPPRYAAARASRAARGTPRHGWHPDGLRRSRQGERTA